MPERDAEYRPVDQEGEDENLSATIRADETVSTTIAITPHLAAPLQIPGLPAERYEVKERLGSGGGGEVYCVLDHHLSREVALKMTHVAATSSSPDGSRFIDEARLTARLDHPNILPIYDLGCDRHDRLFFSMRRVEGRTLADTIKQTAGGSVPDLIARVVDRVELMVRVCDAIAYAHSRDVIHRDIKPGNIVLGDFGEVTVIDWGTACAVTAATNDSGKLVGTPLYMSPEQARAEPADRRSDVYCLGATLWHLLTLSRPTEEGLDKPAFWLKKQEGILPEPPSSFPPTLLPIALRAMAKEPAERYPSALELRDALKEWQRHQASMVLTERTLRDLETVEESEEYASYTRVVDGFRRALEDWESNAEACSGLSRALAASSRFALRRGDFGLALDVLDPADPSHEAIRLEVAAAREKLARDRRRTIRVRLAAAVLVLSVVAAGLFWFLDYQRSIGAWQLGWQLDVGKSLSAQLEPADDPRATAAPGQAGGVRLVRGQLYWLTGAEAKGNVHVEADVEWPEAVDGFELVLRAPRVKEQLRWQVPPGYSCQFGGWNGIVSFISENRQTGGPKMTHSVGLEFKPGRRYRLAFSVSADAATIEVDGQKRLELQSLLPLGDSEFRHIAVRSWGDVIVHGLTVRRQALPQKPSPLLAGDALVGAGLYAQAARTYREVSEDFRGTAIADQALARAYFSASLAGEPLQMREKLLARLRAEHPLSRHLPRCEEVGAADAWAARDLEAGLTRAENVLARHPDSRVALALLESRPRVLARPFARRLLLLVSRTPDIAGLDISFMDVGDLEPLRGMKLVNLHAIGSGITSLEPLRGMPLRWLEVAGNAISDLGPLKGIPLRNVNLSDTKIAHIRDLSTEILQGLSIVRTQVSDLSPLTGAKLSWLILANTEVTSLEAIRGMPLDALVINGLGLRDISPLTDMPLRSLGAAYNQITDLAPIAGKREWLWLDLSHNAVRDLGPLSGAFGGAIDLSHNQIADVSPLADGQFKAIVVSHNPIADLSPLAKNPPATLEAAGLPPIRLLPFAPGATTSFALGNTKLLDPASILALPRMERILGPLTELAASKLESLARELAFRGRDARLVRSLRIHAALARHDVDELKELAKHVKGQRLLALPVHLTYEEAALTAQSLGATLPMLDDPDVREAFEEELVEGERAWLPIEVKAGTLWWRDGRMADASALERDARSALASAVALYAGRNLGRVAWYGVFPFEAPTLRALVIVSWDAAPGSPP